MEGLEMGSLPLKNTGLSESRRCLQVLTGGFLYDPNPADI